MNPFSPPVDRHDLHALMVPGCPACEARYIAREQARHPEHWGAS